MPLGAVTHSAALAVSLKASPPRHDVRSLLPPLLLPARKLCTVSDFPTISIFYPVSRSSIIAFSSFHVKTPLRMGADQYKAV